QILLDDLVARLVEPKLQRIAVESAQALDWRVVVEFRSWLSGGIDRSPATHEHFSKQHQATPTKVRIEASLERVNVVFGGKLARLAPEGRVIGEIDAGFDGDSPGEAIVTDLRKGSCRVWGE